MAGSLSPLHLGVPISAIAKAISISEELATSIMEAITAAVGGQIDAAISDAKATLESNYQTLVPLTGFTVTVADKKTGLFLNPAGTLAAGTITLDASPVDGQEIVICSSQIVTSLTLNGGGTTVLGAITALAANTPIKYKAVTIASTVYWMRS